MISPNNQATFQNVNQQGRLSNAFFIHGGRETALNYPVAAGYEAFLVDEEIKMFFIKSNEPNGRGFNLREFTYEEITSKSDPVGNFDPSKYATKEDFNALLEEIKKLNIRRDRGHKYNNRNNRRSRNGKLNNESV